MAKYDHGGGCDCGLYAECEPNCEHNPNKLSSPTCSRCQVLMKQGIGINPTTPDWQLRSMRGPEVAINHQTLTLDPVWKCPKCGHSKDLVNDRP